MTRREPADVRRQQILTALMRVIARDGVAAVSVRTVATEVGLSPSALRYHFASQESLLSAQVAAGLTAATKNPDDFDLDDAAARLAAAIEQFIPLTEPLLAPVKALYGTIVAGYALPTVAQSVRDLYAHTRRIISSWVADLSPDRVSDPLAVDDIMSLIDGLSMGLLVGNTSPDTARRLITQRSAAIVNRRAASPT